MNSSKDNRAKNIPAIKVIDNNIIRKFDSAVYSEIYNGKNRPVSLSRYLEDGSDTTHLYKLGVTGGILKYKFKTDVNQLWILTEYNSPRKLNKNELNKLVEFTKGQWLDGAGPNFTGELSDENNGISPLSNPQKIHVSQNGS